MTEPKAPPLIPELLDATLVLVRHGESEFIVQGRFQGHAETALSPAGLRQAALVADRLAHPHDPPALPLPDGPLQDEDIESIDDSGTTPGADADGTDGGDADGTDGGDADGTDGDSTDTTDGDSGDADGTDA